MPGRHLVRLVIAGAVLAPLACLAAEAAPPDCSMNTIETVPAAAIEPCTRRIAEPDLAPDDRATAFYLRARGYHRTGRLDLAAQDYDVAIKLAPNRAEFYVHRANVAYRHGDFQASYADLMQTLALDPRNARAFFALGVTYQDAGQPDQAIDFYNQALSIDPAEPYALMSRSRLLMRQHKFDEAMRDADALVAIPAPVINRLGYVNTRSKVEDFHVVALTHRAELLLQLGRTKEAESDYDAAVAAKWSSEALVPRGEYRLMQPGQLDAAIKDLGEAVRLDPDEYRADYDYALALTQANRFGEALAPLDRAIAVFPEVGQARVMRARLYRDLGRTDEAVAELEKAMAVDPRVRAPVRRAFVAAGYLDAKDEIAPNADEQHAAAQACMVDPKCN